MGTFQAKSFVLKNGRNITIRSAVPDDAAATIEFDRGVLPESPFLVTQPGERCNTMEEQRKWIQERIDAPCELTLLGLCDGQVVGLCSIFSNHRRIMLRHAANLAISVRAAFRTVGLGRTLMRRAIQWAEDHPDLERLNLAVMAPNAPAIALYRKLGFVEEGYCARAFKRPDGQYVDDVLMVRWLKSPQAPPPVLPDAAVAAPPLLQPTLTTSRLILRAPTLADAAELQKKIGDRAIADTTVNIPHPYGPGEAEKWISKQAGQLICGTAVNFVILLRATGELVGGAGLEIDRRHAQAELGYWIAVPFWRKGYATEAAGALVDYALTGLNLRRVFAHHLTRNPASGAVMRKLGMTYEGTLRQHIVKWDKREDVAIYGLLQDEWRAGK